MTFKTVARIAFIPALFATLAACNTVEGAGQDIEAGGKAVQRGANQVEQDLSE